MHVDLKEPVDELWRLCRREKSAKQACRLRIIILAAEQHTAEEIGRRVDLSPRQVQRYSCEGEAGLADRAGRGSKPLLNAEEADRLRARLDAGPTPFPPGPFGAAPPGFAPPGVQSPFTPPQPPTSSSRNRTARQALPRHGAIIDDRGRDVVQLPEMPEMDGPAPSDAQKGLTLDQRYLCLPQAKLLITIPPSNDKVVFHKLDIDAAPYDAMDPREENGGGGNVASASASAPEPRTWNDKSGKFSIVATFQSFEGGQVKLKKEDGTVLAVALEKLSEADAEFVRTQTKK